MDILHTTDLLVAKTTQGHAKFWQGFVADTGEDIVTYSKAYQEKMPGVPMSQIQSTNKVIKGKNIGRANETTPTAQAILEIEANAKRKMDKGYHVNGEAAPKKLPLPMLAHNYEKRSHNIEWPCFLQPKLDGVRMLFDGKRGWSRQGKDFITEVIQHLQCDLPEGIVLDGELMLDHNDYTFQETMKIVKKYRGDDAPKLEYHVYDIVDETKTFQERHELLNQTWRALQEASPIAIHWVTTTEAVDEKGMHHWHGIWTEEGYEGIMLRNRDALYTPGHRSTGLQKYKHFIDDEYEIVNVMQGQAKEEGCAIFVCKTPAGSLFNVRPKGTVAERREMYDNRTELVGQMLTVKYQNLSDDGIPRFPVGIAIQPDRQPA